MNDREWLESDGLGGFASGTVDGIRTRRYHALLLTATNPPTGRIVLVNGFDAWIETEKGRFALTSQRYNPDIIGPDGHTRIASFHRNPWPTWTFAIEDGTRIQQEIFAVKNSAQVVLAWKLLTPASRAILTVRPFFSGRDYHSLHHENSAYSFEPERRENQMVWRPYPGLPAIHATTNGSYLHDPFWYRNFAYEQERERGLDYIEDLASPGVYSWNLATQATAHCIFSTAADVIAEPDAREQEADRRSKFADPLLLAADAYVVARKKGKTIVAGFPWFTDWGRDTFIAIRGLCLATGRLDDAREILLEWSGAVSEGMLPNRFPDQGEEPEYNSVDASLWYAIAVSDFLQMARHVAESEKLQLTRSVEEILTGYEQGTRFGIRKDADGLLAAGAPGYQLTWMDARVNGREVTPRIGKPVEIQALWINALAFGSSFSEKWQAAYERAMRSFQDKFWNEKAGCLYDVVDVDHHAGRTDDSLRPNQILAVGGLPVQLVEGEKARSIVDVVRQNLLTPMGLRSLSPGAPGYASHYTGGVAERDGIYHQGTVWPWLIGPFVEAWMRVYPEGASSASDYLQPLVDHLHQAGMGHISEIADAEAPFTPRGCPFQAWSLGEFLRVQRLFSQRREGAKI